MAGFTLKLNTVLMERATKRLKERAPQAVARALNRAAASAVTAMIRAISQDTGIKQADLRGTTKRNRAIWASDAVPGRLTATVYAATERIPLMDFNARTTKRGVTARVQGGRQLYPGLFIATMGSGHTGVFGRAKAKEQSTAVMRARSIDALLRGAFRSGLVDRLPIVERRGPSIAHVWYKHAQIGRDRAKQQLLKNLASEFRFAMSKGA